jgi:hypothetical protein
MNWKQKLAESLIDRIVLVVLAAVLLGAVEWQYTKLQKASDARAAVATVMTDALIQQRSNLMSAVQDYMLLIDNMIETNKSSSPKLSAIERRIRLASGFFAAVSSDSAVSDNARAMEASMVRLSNFVRGDRTTEEEENQSLVEVQQSLQDKFMENYVAFTSDIRTVTLEAVELESASR